MTQKDIKDLKEKLELHYNTLQTKYPMTKIVIEAIDSLLEMNASDDLIRPWYGSIKNFILDIEREISKIEIQKGFEYDTL